MILTFTAAQLEEAATLYRNHKVDGIKYLWALNGRKGLKAIADLLDEYTKPIPADQQYFGTMIAQALTSRLIQAFPQLTYKEVADVVYKTMQDISDFSEIGDWISMPDATTFTCTFKPKQK